MYLYDASALALAGEIRRPSQHVIESQAATCLAMTGGIARAEIEDFQIKGIVSLQRAFTEVSGAADLDGQTHNTSVRVVVEGLNVLDVLSADRVIARLSSRYSSKDPEARIVANGTYFENLRIEGEPVQIELATKFFEENDTFAKFEDAYSRSPDDLFGGRRSRRYGRDPRQELHWVSLVKRVSLQSPFSLKHGGSTIEIPNFGRIHLAECFIQRSRRQLNMLRVELGSPVAGTLLIATASCNGLGGDPGTDDP